MKELRDKTAQILKHLPDLIEMAASEEARKIEIRRFLAWLQEKTGTKFYYPNHPTRTKFDRQCWEDFHATCKKNSNDKGLLFESKRKAALGRVGKYKAERGQE